VKGEWANARKALHHQPASPCIARTTYRNFESEKIIQLAYAYLASPS